MKSLILFCLVALSACATLPSAPSTPCGSKVAMNGLGSEKTVMRMVFQPMLIGGKPADAAEWPASVYARAGSSACSATLVGDRVLFIASHCVANGGQVTFSAHANNYTARCNQHPEYRKNATADWSLCLVDRPVTGVAFEVMGVDEKLEIGQPLLLSGYGCVKPGGGGGNDGIFRIGNADIKGLPSGKTYDIVTKGGAALCFGDSGGSAFKLMTDGNRHIVAVNSRGDISTMSYLPAVSSPTFLSWAQSWAKDANNVRICGIHDDALGCRSVGVPLPDGNFEVQAKAACVKGTVQADYLDKKEQIVDGVKKTLDQF